MKSSESLQTFLERIRPVTAILVLLKRAEKDPNEWELVGRYSLYPDAPNKIPEEYMGCDIDEWSFWPGKDGHLHLTVKITKLYICDHEKNQSCEKTSCGYLGRGECFLTLDKEFAKEDN